MLSTKIGSSREGVVMLMGEKMKTEGGGKFVVLQSISDATRVLMRKHATKVVVINRTTINCLDFICHRDH